MLILFMFSMGFISASNAIDNDSQNMITDDCLDSVSTEESIGLSEFSDADELNAAEEDTFQSGNDEVLASDVMPSGKTFSDIQKAVNDAKANDVIVLDGTYGGSSEKSLAVNKSLVFEGNGMAILDAGSKVMLDIENNSNIEFRNIVFKNFCCEDGEFFGGRYGVWFIGKNLSIFNCSFINSGIVFDGKNLTVKDSSFKNSSLIYWGGKSASVTNIDLIKSLIYAEGHNFTIKNSKFTDKSTMKAVGVNAKIVNCNFKSNNNNNETTIFKDFYTQLSITKNNKTTKYPSGDNIIFLDSLKSYKLWYVKPIKTVTAYKSAAKLSFKLFKGYLKKKPASKWLLRIELTKGKKSWNYYGTYDFLETDKNGCVYLKTSNLKISREMFSGYTIYNNKKGKKNLAPGTYKISINNMASDALDSDYSHLFFSYKGIIRIKVPTTVKAPKIVAKYKKSNYFKVTLKKKSNKKALNAIKLKLKVYTGKKFKTITIKTNKRGIAKFNTKNLKKGKHKVIVSSDNTYYLISKKSSIRIR